MISRKNRIDNPTEVREILKDGDVYAGKHIMLFYRPTSAPARVGVIFFVGKETPAFKQARNCPACGIITLNH